MVIPALAVRWAAGKALAGRVPRGVWIALAVALALLLIWRWDSARLSSARNAGDAAGYARAMGEVEAKAKKLATEAEALTAKIRSRTNEENRRVGAAADTLRLRGPGRAACPSAAPSGSGRHEPPAGQANAPVGRVSYPERIEFIALPFAPTIAFAEQCDLNRAEAQAWRDQHKGLIEAWEQQTRK